MSSFLPLLVAAGLVWCSAARADVYNRQFIPLGERQAFMGNAGTGDSADTGAVYYNPAGLAALNLNRASVTGAVYLSFKTHTDAVGTFDNTNIPYDASGFITIPSSYTAVIRHENYALAFSALVPDSIAVENKADIQTPNTNGNILQSFQSQDLWLGGSFAFSASPEWKFGATLFVIQHSESQLAAVRLVVPGTANTVATSLGRTSLSVWDLSLVLGARYEVSPQLSFGFRIQTPTVGIHGSADEFSSSDSVASGTLTSTVTNQTGTKAVYRLPLDFTLGTAIRPSRTFELVLDASYQTAVQYQSIPSSSQGQTIDTVGTLRANLGAEVRLSPKWPLRAGFFYDPSTVRQVTAGSPGTKDDYYGATAGLLFVGPHVETGIGFFDIWGSGPASATGTTTLVSSSASGLGALLTTAYVF